MAKHGSPLEKLNAQASAIAAEMGFQFIETELAREPEGLFLRFYIDKPGGITLDDCEKYHKLVQPLSDDVDFDYMEVSSPGADRPLKTPEDFERMRGERVEVKLYKPLFGAKRHTGFLLGLNGEGDVLLKSDSGEELAFPRKGTALVRPLIEFTEEDLADESPAND